MLRLDCEAKQYRWGQLGEVSLVADLSWHGSGAKVHHDEPYAELWMGAHTSGPSRLKGTGETLTSWLARHPQALGQGVLSQYGKCLPFLFKVLSIEKALSIQSHPDKVLAQQLNALRPDIYKDDNHKPELALAVRHKTFVTVFLPFSLHAMA
jgi:mannose-6-phosphate isomerase